MCFSRPSMRSVLRVLPTAILIFFAAIAIQSPTPLDAQIVGGVVTQAVGGISIKSDGLIENAGVDTLGKLRAERARLIKKAPADLNAAASLRKISLRQYGSGPSSSIAEDRERRCRTRFARPGRLAADSLRVRRARATRYHPGRPGQRLAHGQP